MPMTIRPINGAYRFPWVNQDIVKNWEDAVIERIKKAALLLGIVVLITK